MARYSQSHKDATRQRIITSAGTRMKRDGIDGSGIAALMADAGLTNGAFYAHFTSKDDLVATVVEEELRVQAASFKTLAPGAAGIEQLLHAYLSPEHRDNSDAGCPSAALLDEIGRAAEDTKRAYTTGTRAILDEIAERLAPGDPATAYGTAQSLFTMIVGTLQLSRAAADTDLADEILSNGVRSGLALLDVPHHPNQESEIT